MKKSISLPMFLLSLAILGLSGQSLAAVNDEVKAQIDKQCQTEAEGAIDPEIIKQYCIEEKMQELMGEAEGQDKEES